MLIDAALRSGQIHEAKSLLRERLMHRPRDTWAGQHLAQCSIGSESL
jgi:hypothetical protein